MTGDIPVPVISLAIRPKADADRPNLDRGLRHLMAEDPTLRAETNKATGEAVIACAGEVHLEIVVDRLKREFGVEASVGRPQVLYRETVTCAAGGEAKYARQTGGRGEYGHVRIHLFPGDPGSGYVFENRIIGGSIPSEFITPIEEGIDNARARGALAGYPVDDVRVELHDGSYHDVDSSDMAFRMAGSMAFQDAVRKAKPVVLEPMVRVEVTLPWEHIGDVLADLLGRRGRILTKHERGDIRIISARVPVVEMFGYASNLREGTRGRATYSMQFDRYQPVPGRPDRTDPDASDDDRSSFVGAPRKPAPAPNASAVALPEPDDDDRRENLTGSAAQHIPFHCTAILVSPSHFAAERSRHRDGEESGLVDGRIRAAFISRRRT